MNHNRAEHESLEQILFEFEQAWFANPATGIEPFLPPASSENYLDVLTELARSEMEFRSANNGRIAAEEYFRRFPILAKDATAKRAIVYEEYRLRTAAGDQVARQSLLDQYGIESVDWPKADKPSTAGPSTTVPPDADGKTKSALKFPTVGDTIGDFSLVGQLGEGAFGRVFLAQQGELEGRLVVLKFTSRRTDEHRLLAKLQHTNIVPIHSVHRSGDLQAICMPLLGVTTLADILRFLGNSGPDRVSQHSNALVSTVNRHRERTVVETIDVSANAARFETHQRLSAGTPQPNSDPSMPEFAARFIQKMSEGLGYAHQRGIVHGDLKPANLLVSDDGEPVILDFHLGHSQADDFGSMIGGTLPYMAPEHLLAMSRNEIRLLPTMDVYSTGAILYEMLTGRLPFQDELELTFSPEQLARIKTQPFVIPADERRMFGEDLAAITETCLDPEPKNRFANGSELAAELNRSLAHQPLQIAGNGSLRNRIAKWSRRNPRLSSGSTILAACSVLIAATAIALWVVNSRLGDLRAISASQARVLSAESIVPILATADFQRDHSFFESATQQGNSLLKSNGWSNANQLRSTAGFNRLDEEMASAESLAAAETHFWMAENCRRAARFGNRSENLRTAEEHNRQAQAIWPIQHSQVALKLQQVLIAATMNHSKPEPELMANVGSSDNERDAAMAIHLQPTNIQLKQKEYLRLVEADRDNFKNWLLLGNACVAQNALEQAESWYTVCISIDPESYLPRLYRGMARMEMGKHAEALEDLRIANAKEPDDITILLNYGLALGKARELKMALEQYDRAIELGARQTRAWLLRSQLKNAQGDKSGAESDFQKFMQLEPVDEKSCITRGIQKIKNLPNEAIEDFQAALTYNPQSLDANNNIAHVYSEVLGDNAKGIEYMDRVIELNGLNPKSVASRGVLLARIGKIEPAVADAQLALRLNSSADTRYRVAGIYAQLSKLDEKFATLATEQLAHAAYENPQLVKKMRATDPDLTAIQGNDDFESIFESISGLEQQMGDPEDSRKKIENAGG